MLVWFAILGKLNTEDKLLRLKILHGNDIRCVLCGFEPDSINHLFLHCNFNWRIWCLCLSWEGVMWAMPVELKGQFEAWLDTNFSGSNRRTWSILFFVVIWASWKLRNKVVFEKVDAS